MRPRNISYRCFALPNGFGVSRRGRGWCPGDCGPDPRLDRPRPKTTCDRARSARLESFDRVPRRMTEIVRATSAEHFAQFHELVGELMAWDSATSAQLGLDVDSILDFLYNQPGGTADDQANLDVILATHQGDLAGCGALKQLSNEAGELSRLYVRPAYRGRGIGKAILDAILASARARGFQSLSLETATFMTEAHSLYRSLGFQVTEPFRHVPESLEDAEIFMSLRLGEPT